METTPGSSLISVENVSGLIILSAPFVLLSGKLLCFEEGRKGGRERKRAKEGWKGRTIGE